MLLTAQDEDQELTAGFSDVEALLNLTQAVLVQCWGQMPDVKCIQKNKERRKIAVSADGQHFPAVQL